MAKIRELISVLLRPWRWVRSWPMHWQNLSIRRRILLAMLAVSVIPLTIFSLAGVGAVAFLNNGALGTANNELVRSQGSHLEELVQSRAALVNDELSAIQTQIGLLGLSANSDLMATPSGGSRATTPVDATILGPGSSGEGARAQALRALEAEMSEIAELHPEVAEVWVQLPQSGLLAVSPSSAITTSEKSQFEQLLPSQQVYQLGLGQEQLADSLKQGQWRQLLANAPLTAVWTPVYSNPMAGGQTVTVATEGTTASGLEYRAGANITVQNLVSTFLLGPPGSAQGSYAFLVSNSGTVISVGKGGTAALGLKTKGKQALQPVSLTASHNPWAAVANNMKLGNQGSQQITLDGQPVDVFYSPLPASRWSLGVALPVAGLDSSVVGFSNEISRGLLGMVLLLLPVLLLLAVLVVAVTNVLSGRLVGPLTRLTRASERIASGDLSTSVPVSSAGTDEVGMLERTLERMRRRLAEQHDQIERSHQELEQKVELRTRQLTQRNQELAALNSLTGEMSSSLVLSEIALSVADQVRSFWKLPGVAVYVADGLDTSSLRLVGSSEGGGPERPGSGFDPFIRGFAGEVPEITEISGTMFMPLTTGGMTVGCLALRQTTPLGARQLELLQILGGQLALALRNAQLFADTQEMATINERNRLAREIHDTLAQGLTGIIVQLEAADALLAVAPDRSRDAVSQAADLARYSLQEARGSVWDLRPEGLQKAGLAGAVRDELTRIGARSEVQTSLKLRGMRGMALPAPVEIAVFRIVREAVSNAINHGHPKSIRVEMERRGSELTVVVIDDGAGFDPAGAVRPGSFGMTSMRERAENCGGSLELSSSPGAGARITLRVPCPEAAARRSSG